MRGKDRLRHGLFWGGYILYLMSTTLQFTMYTEVGSFGSVMILARYLAFALAGGKILWDLLLLCRNIDGKLSITRDALGCGVKYALMMALVLIVSLTSGDRGLVYVLMLLLASKDISLNGIFAVTLPIQVLLLVTVSLSSMVGILPDLTYARADDTIRHSLGFTYPTVIMTYVFFALVVAMWRQKKGLSILGGIGLMAVNVILFWLTDARNGFLMGAVVIVVEMILGLRRYWMPWWERLRNTKGGGIVCAVSRHVYDYCAVYLSGALLLFCLTYPWKPVVFLNGLLSDRIRLTAQAAMDYGIHWFGNSIEWIGYGGLVDWTSVADSYNFVDSSYALTLFNYGIFLSIGVLVLLVLLGKQLRKQMDWNHCFLYFVVLCYCFIEPRLLEIHLNVLLFAAAPILYSCPKADWIRRACGKG